MSQTVDQISEAGTKDRSHTSDLGISKLASPSSLLAARQRSILEIASRQSGSNPYDNYRHIYVSGKWAGLTLIEFLARYQPYVDLSCWRQWIDNGQLTWNGSAVAADWVVREGQHFVHHQPNTTEPIINPSIFILHEDSCLVVVNKPAPLPTHPSGRFNRNTLTWILDQAYPESELRLAHRIDANTSGLVVLGRTVQATRFVQTQFERGEVEKRYCARVFGYPSWDERTCHAAIETEPGAGGSRQISDLPSAGACVTYFKVLGRCDDGTSLIEARPQTGRTHQIRVHLSHLGFPIVGDPLYLPGGKVGKNRTLSVADAPMCLHAEQVTLIHPDSNLQIVLQATPPTWLQ